MGRWLGENCSMGFRSFKQRTPTPEEPNMTKHVMQKHPDAGENHGKDAQRGSEEVGQRNEAQMGGGARSLERIVRTGSTAGSLQE
jgi:hypothetical protein